MIVTIHYHDGATQDIECPEGTKWVEMLSNGVIYAHRLEPKTEDSFCGELMGFYVGGKQVDLCLDGHSPQEDGINKSILLKVEEI